MRKMPMHETETPCFSLHSHTFDVQIKQGKWSISIDSNSGHGVFHGPAEDGRLWFQGKALMQASGPLPARVALLLVEHGYDPLH